MKYKKYDSKKTILVKSFCEFTNALKNAISEFAEQKNKDIERLKRLVELKKNVRKDN